MRVLYAIQGTGNGHLSRSTDLIKKLEDYCEVDVLLSGTQVELKTELQIKYRLQGLSFIFGQRGGIDLFQTWKRNNVKTLIKEIRELPIKRYDLVINDFEPISAWAAWINGIPCYSVSNQCVTLHPSAPKAAKFDPIGKLILRHYAPSSANFGFHLDHYSSNIYDPVIRDEIRSAENKNEGHYTVYLAAYSDESILKVLSRLSNQKWEVFSKRAKATKIIGNVIIRPVGNKEFIKSLTSSKGIICNSGFQTITEALFLGKKILTIPMHAQYEQQCIAKALEDLGGCTIKTFGMGSIKKIADWLENGPVIKMDYVDQRDQMLRDILLNYVRSVDPYTEYLERGQYSVA